MNIPKIGLYYRSTITNVNNFLDKNTATMDIDIGHGQFEYLLFIASNEGITQNELANLKYVGKAAVTKAVKILEMKNLIKRILRKNDKRAYELYLTDYGREKVGELFSFQQHIEKEIFKDITDNERNQFLKTLEKVWKNSEGVKDKLL